MRPLPSSLVCAWFGAAVFLGMAVSVPAAPPAISSIELRGLQIGQATALTITGTDLLPNPRLLSTAPIAKQTLKAGAKPERITIEVELAPGAQPGLENWWLITDDGVSARGILATDRLAQKPFAEKIASLPVALHGTLSASQVREVTFPGKAGQEIICEVEAQRLESKVRPVLKLYAPGKVMLKWSLPQAVLRGDTRLEAKLPADGEYRLQFHDLQYAAAAPGHFRLKIGHWSYADVAFPSTIQRGASAEVQLVGRPGETSIVRLPSDADGPAVPAPWADPASSSGPPAAVRLSDLPELVEERPGSAPQSLPALPVAVNGRIGKPGEDDTYEITVAADTEVDFEVSADLLGSPIDAELELRDLKGARLAINDDAGTSPDPRLTYKVPKDVGKLIAVVRDVNGNGGPPCIYRLLATVKAKDKPGSFTLTMIEDSHTVVPGRASVFKVEVGRNGYDGPIELSFDDLPDGLKVSGHIIPARATGTLLTLSSDDPLPPLITGLIGRAQQVETRARFDSVQLGKSQPWLENNLALAGASKPPIAFSAEWSPAAESKKFPVAGKLTLPVKCSRPPGHDGPVRLTLLTSQARQFARGAVDNARTLREERAVLIDEDKKAQQAFDAIAPAKAALSAAQKEAGAGQEDNAAEAAARNVELAEAALDRAMIAAAEAAQKARNDTEVPLVVPADLPEIPHQIAFKAELLKRDRRTVEAVAYTPVQEFPVVNPLIVKLSPPAPAKLDAKNGATLELAGRVERFEGAAGEVNLTLAGLPPGASGPTTATVKSGATEFKFVLKFPANFKPGEFPGVKVSATGRPFGAQQVRGRDAEVTLKVLPPDAAPESKPAGTT